MNKVSTRRIGYNLHIKVNNINVHYNDDGPDGAPVIILIHGFPFNKSMWNVQMEALKDNYRVLAYDIRGHGDSGIGKADFSIELFVDDLISLMDALEIEKATLCGLSMGGYIALLALEKYPERFEALILSDTQCIADTPEAKEKRMQAIENIRENGVEIYAGLMIKNLFAAESFVTKPLIVAAVKEMILKTSQQSLSNTLYALSIHKETCSKLPEIGVPVLILVGKEDKITPPLAARLMHEKIQDSSLNIIDHAGHLANLESPHEFNFKVKKFMQQVANGPYRLGSIFNN